MSLDALGLGAAKVAVLLCFFACLSWVQQIALWDRSLMFPVFEVFGIWT